MARAGAVVTASKGELVVSDTVLGSDITLTVPDKGQWTLSAVYDGGNAVPVVVDVQEEEATYEAQLHFLVLTVTAPAGAEVTAAKDGDSIRKTAAAGTVDLYLTGPGLWTVSAVYDGAASQQVTVDVNAGQDAYTAEPAFATLEVTAPAGSTITAKNGATTLTDTGGTVKFYLPNTGSWTVSASLGGDSTSSEVQCNAYQSYSVELSYAPPENMNDATWAELHKFSAAGKLGDYYDVGDGKDISLNGTVGSLNVSNLTITVFILGFNHNASLEGNSKTHLAIGKMGGRMVSLCDSTYESQQNDSPCFCMNQSLTVKGGWGASYMRQTILGNGGTPSSPSSNSLMASLPSDLRDVMQPITKYTDNAGTGESNSSSSDVTATTDYMWLLSEFEVFGSISNSNEYEKNSQQQYDYFRLGNPKQAYKHTDNSASVWWLRSPYPVPILNVFFCAVDSDGSNTYKNVQYSFGLFSSFAI